MSSLEEWYEPEGLEKGVANLPHPAIHQLSENIQQLNDALKDYQKSIIRSEERIILLSQRLETLENLMTSGANAIMTRVALLEQTDRTMYGLRYEDQKELRNLKTLAQIIEGFPFGFKGLMIAIIILVITTTTVIDLFVQVNGVSDSLRHQLQLKD
jgi:uncharacterized coiled-coil protein SlyX